MRAGGVDGSRRSASVEETTRGATGASVSDEATRASSASRRKDDRVRSDDPDRGERLDDTVLSRLDDTVLRRTDRRGSAAVGAETRAPAPRRLSGVVIGDSVFRLDGPVIVGRRPTAPRVVRGAAPRLVSVPSPTHEVSGSHVEFRQDGDVVVVTDLRSTNGTTVRSPARLPVRLRQGESTVAVPGTIVDLGDGNSLEIVAPLRSTAQEEPHT